MREYSITNLVIGTAGHPIFLFIAQNEQINSAGVKCTVIVFVLPLTLCLKELLPELVLLAAGGEGNDTSSIVNRSGLCECSSMSSNSMHAYGGPGTTIKLTNDMSIAS